MKQNKTSHNKHFQLKLKGKTAVFIDWANVYYWKDKLKKQVDPGKLWDYLKTYKEIKDIRFYYGTDLSWPGSKDLLNEVKKIGYYLVTKPVKQIKIYDKDTKKPVWIRKCDFDLEIGLDCYEMLDKFDSFIFFSGDGDFAALYERLIKRNKQVIVVYVKYHLGREIWDMKKGIFKVELKNIMDV